MHIFSASRSFFSRAKIRDNRDAFFSCARARARAITPQLFAAAVLSKTISRLLPSLYRLG